MTDPIFFISDDGLTVEAARTPYMAEDEIQKLLADNVHLLPGAQIDPDDPRRWLLVRREAGIPDREGGGGWWAVDLLLVDQDAIPTFVEVKRATDTRARREVVAQMLDYAANGSLYLSPEQLREWLEADDAAAAERLAALTGPRDDEDPGESADVFWQKVGDNLREGRVRLIFVADEIPASLQRLVEFLNEQMPRIEVLAVEIKRYQAPGGGQSALVPSLTGQTSRAQSVKERTVPAVRRSTPWTFDEVAESVAGFGEEMAAVARVLQSWAERPHVRVTGGLGPRYPGVTMSVDTGRPKSRSVGILWLYSSTTGQSPKLELRINEMCRAFPRDRDQAAVQLINDLHGLGIGRLNVEADLTSKQPSIPLNELTDGRIDNLLAVIDHWIDDVRTTY